MLMNYITIDYLLFTKSYEVDFSLIVHVPDKMLVPYVGRGKIFVVSTCWWDQWISVNRILHGNPTKIVVII